ncbi:hypothetical protein CERZMDRAFT_100451 [Cercospora zeae-maydis SCOH1-5]|uniref:DNA (cytosine-5-)-methyltransferase n=1 Tax=Cercospora zeae-maydis SCOH1-5 TaxID=717836 RepID=A0A6A6F646_9PEZI|nr:hypothetical protein CERZMDRAFT_100451 [Cercospora zeae-maydis SCOH1-5]
MALEDSSSSTSRRATAPTTQPTSSTASRASSRTMSASPEIVTIDDSDDEMLMLPSRRNAQDTDARARRARTQSQPSSDASSQYSDVTRVRGPGIDEHDTIVIEDENDDEAERLEENASQEALATFQTSAVPDGHEQLEFAATRYDQIISRGVSVDLNDGAFMRIAVVVRDRTAPYTILVGGNLLRRHGHIDRRASKHGWMLHSWMPLRKNELCAVVRVTTNGEAPRLGESLTFRPLDQIGLVRDIIFTNCPWDGKASGHQKYIYRCEQHRRGLASGNDQNCLMCVDNREVNGLLTCRWKYVEEINLQRNKIVGWQIVQLERDECTAGHGLYPISKLATFRGLDQQQTKVLGPSGEDPNREANSAKRALEAESQGGRDRVGRNQKRTKRSSNNLIDLTLSDHDSELSARSESVENNVDRITVTNPETGEVEIFVFPIDENVQCSSGSRSKGKEKAAVPLSPTHHRRKRAYTFVDICAGAGGTARGAKMAGLMLKHLVDNMPDACQSLRLNFGNEVVLEIDMTDFIQGDGSYQADIMHVSFPCQGHSNLNRGLNPEKDAANIALPYGTFGELLKMCKPRILTMEQVNSILTKNEGQHLRSQIHTLVSMGYNVRWASHVLSDYGNPQGRHRLIVIASCPGQTLPKWPERTHGGPGLRPFVSIGDTLDQVRPPGYNREVMEHAVRRKPGERIPYSRTERLRGCITSSGGYRRDKPNNNYHPSGMRDFNHQEKSQLQGFPHYHCFYGNITSVGKQIGNAVPPVFAEKLFRSCIQSLEETDKLVEEYLMPIDID